MGIEPQFHSLAFVQITEPDFADVIVGILPLGASLDPRVWAETIFGIAGAPRWVRGALRLRQLLAPLIGVRRASKVVFAVKRIEGQEALIFAPDSHLDFACAIGVDATARLVRVTTAVRLHGWRGRLYFAPVSLVHPIVVQSMLKRASRTLGTAA
jgi:hypothetical protein